MLPLLIISIILGEAIAAEENNPNPVNQESVNGGDICESCGATDVPKTQQERQVSMIERLHLLPGTERQNPTPKLEIQHSLPKIVQ